MYKFMNFALKRDVSSHRKKRLNVSTFETIDKN